LDSALTTWNGSNRMLIKKRADIKVFDSPSELRVVHRVMHAFWGQFVVYSGSSC
jgi:hypothetical protein